MLAESATASHTTLPLTSLSTALCAAVVAPVHRTVCVQTAPYVTGVALTSERVKTQGLIVLNAMSS